MTKTDYIVIEKTYSPEVTNKMIQFTTHDLPIHWSIRLRNTYFFSSLVGSDEIVDLNNSKTIVTVNNEKGLKCLDTVLDFKMTEEKYESINNTGKLIFKIRIEIPKISSNIGSINFRSEETVHDRILVIGNEKFYVTSGYLATWSNYFNVLFNGEFAEKDKKEITIEEVDPVEFEELLKVIYPTRKDVDDSNVVYLWKLADRFDMPILITMCEEYVSTAPGFYTIPLPILEKFELAQSMKSDKLGKKCRALTEMVTYI